jgi:hypothetical protein
MELPKSQGAGMLPISFLCTLYSDQCPQCRDINVHADVAMASEEDEEEEEDEDHEEDEDGTAAEDDQTPKTVPQPKVPPPLAGRQPGFKRTSNAIEQLGVAASALMASMIPQNTTHPAPAPQCPPHQYNHLVCGTNITLYCARCGDVKNLASP